MKVVTVIFGILVILFLSEQSNVTVRLSEKKHIVLSFRLIEIDLTPGDSAGKPSFRHIITPAVKALRFLACNSAVQLRLIRGFRTLANPYITPALCGSATILQLVLSNLIPKSELIVVSDPLSEDDAFEISCSAQVIIFIISLTIFVCHYITSRIRKRADYA